MYDWIRESISDILIAIVMMVIGVATLLQSISSFEPIPKNMLVALGIAEQVELRHTKSSTSIHFTIDGISSKFVYTSILPRIWKAEQLIKPGSLLEVEYTNANQPHIWSFRASHELIFTQSEAQDSYRKNGLMGIVALVFYIPIFLYSIRRVFRRYINSRRYF